MSDEIDANRIAAEVTATLIKDLADAVVNRATKPIRKFLTRFNQDFGPYLQSTYLKCSRLKTILNPNEPTSLDKIYENCLFKCDKTIVQDKLLIKKIREGQRVIITGFGGGGKTVFLKYLWLEMFRDAGGKIPVMIELRRLNDLQTLNLRSFVFRTMVAEHSEFGEDVFLDSMKDGLFVFIFDGFDEIAFDKRDSIERQILELSSKYPDCGVVVSGRDDERFSGWQQFYRYSVQPLSSEQIRSLVTKIDFDPIVKKKFLTAFDGEFFDEHESFLSSPLLLSMMLLTFRSYADIPEKIHVFYDQAFDTLYSRHDATKEAFKRQHRTELSIDVFKRYFSTFCFITYMKEKFEFSETEMLENIDYALRLENSNVNRAMFLKDMCEALCLLHRDGLSYVFVHRSFQEYFTAVYVKTVPPEFIYEILTEISYRILDNVISLLFDMEKELVERTYVRPNLKALVESIEHENAAEQLKGYLKYLDGTLTIVQISPKEKLITFRGKSKNRNFIFVIDRLYQGEIHPKKTKNGQKYSTQWSKEMNTLCGDLEAKNLLEKKTNQPSSSKKYMHRERVVPDTKIDDALSLVSESLVGEFFAEKFDNYRSLHVELGRREYSKYENLMGLISRGRN